MNDLEKDNKIKELEERLQIEIMVKKSEVLINQELKEQIEKKDFHIKTLTELNDEFFNKIIELKLKLKKLID
jgi:hypothetical protein